MRSSCRVPLAVPITAVLAAAIVAGAGGARLSAQSARPYATRPVAEVLRELQRAGLQLIFNDDLVPATLRVKVEPKSRRPREVAIEILAPHGLTLTSGPRNRLLVVKAPRATPPARIVAAPGRGQPPPQPPGPEPASPEALRLEERVNVIARLGDAAGTSMVYTIDADTVRETAGGLENVLQALRVLPGVAGTDDDHGRIAVRGSGPEHNVVLLDGVQIHNPYRFGELTSSFINPSTISRVSLDASGLDAGHGGRLSSVTVIETRDGTSERQLKISGSLGLAAGDVLLEGRLPKTESGSWWATARGTYYRALIGPFSAGSLPSFGDVQVKVSANPSPRAKITVFGLVGREGLNADEIDDDGTRSAVESFKGTNRLGFVNFLWTPGQRFTSTITASAYAHDARDADHLTLLGQPSFERETSVQDLAVRQRALYAFSARHVMDAGVEVHRVRSAWRMAGVKPPIFWRGIGPSTWGEQIAYPESGAVDSALARTQASVWLQDRVPVGSSVTIEPGVRVDWNSFTHESSVQPRLRGTVQIGRTVVWAGLAHQVQTPSHEALQGFDFFRLDRAEGARLRNERLRQIVLGLERPVGAGINLRVEVYRRRLDRLLVQRLETDAERAARLAGFAIPADMPADSALLEHRPMVDAESTGTGTASGVELLFQRTGPRITGWLGYTFSRTSRHAHGYSFPFDFDRPHSVTAAGTWSISKRWRLSATLMYGSGFPVTPLRGDVFFSTLQRPDGTVDPVARPFRWSDGRLVLGPTPATRRLSERNAERLSGYGRTDVRATYATLGHWEFYGEVINLFNTRNYLQTMNAPDVFGGSAFSTKNNIYDKFERLVTFGVRFRF